MILGVQRNASQPQIAQAYRRLAKRYHPDVRHDAQSSERMRRINQAWEILSSPAERARYDADHGPRASSYGHWSAPRRVTPVGAWSAAPSGTSGYVPPFRSDAQSDGPMWPGIILSILLAGFVVLLLFAGILPFPLLGLAIFAVVRGIVRRFDE